MSFKTFIGKLREMTKFRFRTFLEHCKSKESTLVDIDHSWARSEIYFGRYKVKSYTRLLYMNDNNILNGNFKLLLGKIYKK